MLNNLTLVGRMTKDAEVKQTSSGQLVASFTLAVNRNFKNQNGEREADFINCVAWRKTAEIIGDYTSKGSLIGVTGRIQTRNYENQQGHRVYVTEVIAEQVALLESKNSQQNQSAQPDFGRNESPFEKPMSMDIDDSDLPF